jgi:hypothetical protein
MREFKDSVSGITGEDEREPALPAQSAAAARSTSE